MFSCLCLFIFLPFICLCNELLFIINFFTFKRLRYFSFYLSLILFLFSLWFLSIFDKTCFNPQFLFEIGGQLFGVDHLSVWFCILTVFIIPFCIVYSWDLLFYFRSYLIIIFFLEIFILLISCDGEEIKK